MFTYIAYGLVCFSGVIALATGARLVWNAWKEWRGKRKMCSQSDCALKTTGGMVVTAQVNGPKGMPEPKGDTIEAVPDSDERIAYDCGHRGPIKFHFDIFGEAIETDERRLREEHACCPDCIVAEMRLDIIRCALCGHFISPGMPVAAYGEGSDIRVEWATRIPDGGYIGCMRWDCCPSGGFFAGHWLGRGGFRPAFEHGCAAAEAMATGEMVVGDIGLADDEEE